ncbi:MAG: hypothetical protein ACK4TF_10135, partial [Thermodesulfovibrionales bacterium]
GIFFYCHSIELILCEIGYDILKPPFFLTLFFDWRFFLLIIKSSKSSQPKYFSAIPLMFGATMSSINVVWWGVPLHRFTTSPT